MDLEKLQLQHRSWLRHNFPEQRAHLALIGVVEEVGELSHAYLKSQQKIRESSDPNYDPRDDMVDAIGDIVIFLDGFCMDMGIDFPAAVKKTWEKVRQRDWIKYPDTGMPPIPAPPTAEFEAMS